MNVLMNSFRHPLPQLPCAKCDEPLVGVPMDAGDYLYLHDDNHWPAASAFLQPVMHDEVCA